METVSKEDAGNGRCVVSERSSAQIRLPSLMQIWLTPYCPVKPDFWRLSFVLGRIHLHLYQTQIIFKLPIFYKLTSKCARLGPWSITT